MKGRRYALLSTAALVLLTVTTSISAADAPAPTRHRDVTIVRAVGDEAFEPNALIYSTFRFDPGTVLPAPGGSRPPSRPRQCGRRAAYLDGRPPVAATVDDGRSVRRMPRV